MKVVVVLVLVVDVDVDVVVFVGVDVVDVVVSHPEHVLSHCATTETDAHKPSWDKRSHFSMANRLTLPVHLCGVDVEDVVVEVLVDVLVLVDVDVLVEVEVDVDVVVPHAPSLSASFSGSTGQGSSLPQMSSLSTSFSGSAAHSSKHSDLHEQGQTLHIECAMHLPSSAPPSR